MAIAIVPLLVDAAPTGAGIEGALPALADVLPLRQRTPLAQACAEITAAQVRESRRRRWLLSADAVLEELETRIVVYGARSPVPLEVRLRCLALGVGEMVPARARRLREALLDCYPPYLLA